MKFTSQILSFLLVGAAAAPAVAAAGNGSPPPTILDTDFGSFIDDIFAVGLLIQSNDVLDPRLIISTAEQPELSAKCVWEQVRRSELDYDIPIAIGEPLPPYSERGSVCGVPGLIGFALEDTCKDVVIPPDQPLIENGVEYMASMLIESNRTDWTYIVIGGQTSLMTLIRDYPEAAEAIENLVVMGGNFCTGFDPYPDVTAPVDETNVGCDMRAANYVLDANNFAFPNVYYAPVVTASPLSGEDYSLILSAASNGNKPARATIDFYEEWTAAARNNSDLLVHLEAMTYDPATESTPQFDAVAVLIAMDVARGNPSARVLQEEFSNGVHFVTQEEAEESLFADDPKPAFSLWTGNERMERSSGSTGKCKALTTFHFDPSSVTEDPVPIKAGLGFISDEAEQWFFREMAERMAGGMSIQSMPSASFETKASLPIMLLAAFIAFLI